MDRLPTIASLAKARPQTIHKLWEGLGYYSRVRNMQAAGRLIVKEHQGCFPSDFNDVLELPGIGRYTAGAICSIAFNQPTPIVDGNVTRVLARIFGIHGNPRDKAVNERLWGLAEELVKEADQISALPNAPARVRTCSSLNQSLMELGATMCTPRQPNCNDCPATSICVARRDAITHLLPQVAARPAITRRRFFAFVARHADQFLVRQRPAGVVNANLWEFPNIEVHNVRADAGQACRQLLGLTGRVTHLATIHHSITRYRIRLEVFAAAAPRAQAKPVQGDWLKLAQLRKLPFASAHKKVLQRIAAAQPASPSAERLPSRARVCPS